MGILSENDEVKVIAIGSDLIGVGGGGQATGGAAVSHTNDGSPSAEIDIETVVDHEGRGTEFGVHIHPVSEGGEEFLLAQIVAQTADELPSVGFAVDPIGQGEISAFGLAGEIHLSSQVNVQKVNLIIGITAKESSHLVSPSFGIKTATGDSEGEVLAEQTAVALTTDHVTAALTSFVGEFDQTPPMHSALKVDGQPLYKLARQGKEVERKSRRIAVHSIEMTSFAPGVVATSDIRVSCSKGTYIRTLSEDIAEAVGLPGHMSALRRTATGPFDLSQSIDLQTLVDVAEKEGPDALDQFLIDPEIAVGHLERVELSDSAAFYLKQGQPVLVRNAPLSGMVRIAEAGGPFLGIGVILDDGRVAPKRLFV